MHNVQLVMKSSKCLQFSGGINNVSTLNVRVWLKAEVLKGWINSWAGDCAVSQ